LSDRWCASRAGPSRRDRRALDNYPFNLSALGRVDPARLQRVVDVMQQFLGFQGSFNVNSMLTGG
jgi:hypothetical protein